MPIEEHLCPFNNSNILKPESFDRILSFSILVEETSQQRFSQLRMPKDYPQSVDAGHIPYREAHKAYRSWIYRQRL